MDHPRRYPPPLASCRSPRSPARPAGSWHVCVRRPTWATSCCADDVKMPADTTIQRRRVVEGLQSAGGCSRRWGGAAGADLMSRGTLSGARRSLVLVVPLEGVRCRLGCLRTPSGKLIQGASAGRHERTLLGSVG